MHEIREKHYKRRIFSGVLALIVIAIGIFIIYHYLASLKLQNTTSKVGNPITQSITGPKLFKNEYYQFYSSDPWSYAANDSTAQQKTYLLTEDKVVAASISVYVNVTPDYNNLPVSHAVPVAIKNQNSFTNIGQVSEDCGATYGPHQPIREQNVTLSGTTIFCEPDTTAYSVGVGEIGGDYNLKLKRSNGTIANYIIIYKSLSMDPNIGPLMSLLPTFQAL